MTKPLDEIYNQITDMGAHGFVGWMISAAKSSPRIAQEMRSFREFFERAASEGRRSRVFEDLAPKEPTKA